jgi:hypothetical protein
LTSAPSVPAFAVRRKNIHVEIDRPGTHCRNMMKAPPAAIADL